MSPSYGIEAIVRLIPIKLHLQKLGGRSQLYSYKLPPSHLIHSLIDSSFSTSSNLKANALDSLTNQQHSLVKGHLINMTNRSNKYFPSFASLDSEFSSGCRVIDNFSDHFSFNVCNKEKDNKLYAHQLDEIILESSSFLFIAIIASDASIKNNVTTFIMHIYIFNNPLTKTIHHAVYVTSTEAKLFAIRYGINQITDSDNISKIIVVTDSIHMVHKNFDLSVYSYQVQLIAILSDLRKFFIWHKNNSIEFWECPSHLKQHLHNEVDKETKTFNLNLLSSCKSSQDFSKKCESKDILKVWKMMFQASDLK